MVTRTVKYIQSRHLQSSHRYWQLQAPMRPPGKTVSTVSQCITSVQQLANSRGPYSWLTLAFSGWRVFPTQLVCSSSFSAVGYKQGLPETNRTSFIKDASHADENSTISTEMRRGRRSDVESVRPTLSLCLNGSSRTQAGGEAGGLQGLVVPHELLHPLPKPRSLGLRLFKQITYGVQTDSACVTARTVIKCSIMRKYARAAFFLMSH